MLSVEEVLGLIEKHIGALPVCAVDLDQARGLRLGVPLYADADEPAFDRSAMDGFAIPAGAGVGWYRLVGESLPGGGVPGEVREGEALRVFTGSALPVGVRVVMQEDTVLREDGVEVVRTGGATHVRVRGSAARAGDLLLAAGVQLEAAQLALLAASGQVRPQVVPRARVAHLTTGREIVPPSSVPAPGQIRNTNAPLVRALVESSGARFVEHRHALEDLSGALEICRTPGFAGADLLVVSGGASGGAHDHTGALLEALGFELVCRRVNCRPGKPFLLGVAACGGGRVAVGLPGNPLSHFVTYHVFVRRILERLMGSEDRGWTRVVLENPGVIQSDARETFWPARAERGRAVALPWLDSGHLGALSAVNALLRIPPGTQPEPGAGLDAVECF